MRPTASRRRFLQSSLGLGLGGLAGLEALSRLGQVSAEEARLRPDAVTFSTEIEPLVRLLEETPREELLAVVTQRIRNGLSYRELLTALLLAGIRNVQPRPNVGFKFHAVLVVNSAHLASVAAADEDRWLPILWAVDYFKHAQAQDVAEGDWSMRPVEEARIPSASQARRAFVEAMDRWDVEAADAAIAALARTAGIHEIFEMFFRYGARDLRDIGHKAIFVANSYRLLPWIGVQNAEPVLRSLAYALLAHTGEPNPSQSDLAADRPGRNHQALAREIGDDWLNGLAEPSVVPDLLDALRTASLDAIGPLAVARLNRGLAPATLWDSIFLYAAELNMQSPGIVALHATTTTNALHFAYQTVADDASRRQLLLQNLAFLVHFRERTGAMSRGSALRIDRSLDDPENDAGRPEVQDVFARLRAEPLPSARRAHAFLKQGGTAPQLIDHARRLVFAKGNDSHDYKFSSAVLEDYYHLSPRWRDAYLAGSTFLLCGGDDPDNQLVTRIRQALA